MNDHSFIVDVLTDLENYADNNKLPEMKRAIDEARTVAQVELSQVATLDSRQGLRSTSLNPR